MNSFKNEKNKKNCKIRKMKIAKNLEFSFFSLMKSFNYLIANRIFHSDTNPIDQNERQ